MCGQTAAKKLGIGRRTFHRTIAEMNVWAKLSVARPAAITVEVPTSGATAA
jgi:hypothetical protein